jgi:hypothetical protein
MSLPYDLLQPLRVKTAPPTPRRVVQLQLSICSAVGPPTPRTAGEKCLNADMRKWKARGRIRGEAPRLLAVNSQERVLSPAADKGSTTLQIPSDYYIGYSIMLGRIVDNCSQIPI